MQNPPAFLKRNVSLKSRKKSYPKNPGGDTGTPELRNHCKIAFEVRQRTSTGQATIVGARNVDAAPPIERYFHRGELDPDPMRNDRLFRAAERLHEDYKLSNLEPVGASKFVMSGHSGIPDKFVTLRLSSLRAYNRALRAVDPRCRPVIRFVVVYEGGHVRDWARLCRVKERGAIDILRCGLAELAVHYGLLKKTDVIRREKVELVDA